MHVHCHSMSPGHFASLLAAACLSLPAAAEGPMATDDAGTLGQGGKKIEAVFAREYEARSAELGLGYGLIDNLEIGLSFARETDRDSDPSIKMHGTGIAIKWVPIQNEAGWSLGMRYEYDRKHIDERSTPDKYTEKEHSLTGLTSYRFDDGQVIHINLGGRYTKARGESDSVGTWGIGYEFPMMENLKLTVETFGEEHARPDKAVGLRYAITDGLKFYCAVGHGNGRGFGNVGVASEF